MKLDIPIRAKRVMVNPAAIWMRDQFDCMVEQVVLEETALRAAGGAPGLTEAQCDELRQMVAFRINAETIPAGNA